MKKLLTKNAHTAGMVAVTALFGAALVACTPEFDDPTMAVVMKPEILSIVLSPPEAVPGQTVRATFLMADDRGAIEGNARVWLPMGGSGEPGDEEMGEILAEMGLELEDLGEARFEFTVPPASRFTFDDDGLSGQVVSLFAATGSKPAPGTPVEELLGRLDGLVENGQVEAGIRTLVVSERSNRNWNPKILGIRAGDEEVQETPVELVLSRDTEIEEARGSAAANPLVVREGEEVVFAVDLSDDSNTEKAIRYQWISTGGDFADLRERVQRFEAPGYRELEAGDVDQTGLEDVDPRADPNLHPVWMIVRDNGDPGRLGQSWAEFYVRVEPDR